MKNKVLSNLSHIAEIISALALVISLIYLSVQIRQNTKAVRSSSYTEMANGISDFQILLAQNENLSNLFLRGTEDSEKLTSEELQQFEMVLGHVFTRFDTAVYLYKKNMVDSTAIEPYTKFILSLLDSTSIRTYWEKYKQFFSSGMVEYLDAKKI